MTCEKVYKEKNTLRMNNSMKELKVKGMKQAKGKTKKEKIALDVSS